LSIGESNYRGSPYNRMHNIAVGLNKFNGTLIQSGAVFSFNKILGPVSASSGYKQELVIKGDKTLPDYGGGLCQVSTTAYRGMWEYGFPILQRTNHSYSVRYYYPQGTDATIYPPYKDVKFLNDTGAAILLQTYTGEDKAYFIYYGTTDNRKSDVFGPFVWAKTSAPADKIEYTTDIPVDTERKVGERVPGLKAAWFRILKKNGDEESLIEPVYSHYEARPRFTQIGISNEEYKMQNAE
ncbi:MAG: VanW family protein, partial [Candidatus Peribacteraceae bacterium]|nr:VanW family protein [Candidatus Peribacteraceae bacterium]